MIDVERLALALHEVGEFYGGSFETDVEGAPSAKESSDAAHKASYRLLAESIALAYLAAPSPTPAGEAGE